VASPAERGGDQKMVHLFRIRDDSLFPTVPEEYFFRPDVDDRYLLIWIKAANGHSSQCEIGFSAWFRIDCGSCA
jgi:hypothetical protein